MNLKLSIPKFNNSLFAKLARYEHLAVGVLLIGLFGYTAFVVQQAMNVAADPVIPSVTISFDAKTLESLKSLTVVQGQTPLGNLGKADPFGQ
jgi:hypothetical protein